MIILVINRCDFLLMVFFLSTNQKIKHLKNTHFPSELCLASTSSKTFTNLEILCIYIAFNTMEKLHSNANFFNINLQISDL